jgi:hypothetical protein
LCESAIDDIIKWLLVLLKYICCNLELVGEVGKVRAGDELCEALGRGEKPLVINN